MLIKATREFSDIFPREIDKWQFIEKTAREIYESQGFSEIKIPILERSPGGEGSVKGLPAG